MKKSSFKARAIPILAVLFVLQASLSLGFLQPLWKKNYAPKQTGFAAGLSPDQLLVAVAGFREMVAGILWVRADSFFDTGNYDAILPLIRLVTWLDPKQIDVYATGMWHIGYNFTDEEQRSDRRYIPSALALGKEGAERNPETYEMFFETGWMWYHKIDDDYRKAVEWFLKAHERPDMLPARKNLLSMAYQRDGKPEEAIALLYRLYDEAQKALDAEGAMGRFQSRDTIEGNIDTTLVRMSQRGVFAKNAGLGPGAIPKDIDPPFNVNFSARVTVEEPRVLRVEGTWGVLPVGTRIRVILRDADFRNAVPGGMKWDADDEVSLDPPSGTTFMQDQLFVRNRRFDKRIDMSKDPTMYPFAKPDYVLEFYYNPRSAPPHIQDKFGWNGEGMTDPNFLNLEVRPGQRVIFTDMKLTRDQILRRGEWRDEVPVIQTKNYQAPTKAQLEGDVIQVPGLLAEPAR